MPRLYIGFAEGCNRVCHASGFRSVAGNVLCPDFTDGRADGYYAGITAEYLFGRSSTFRPSVIARVVCDNLLANYRVNGDRLDRLPSVDENRNIVYSTVQHVAEVRYSLIDLDLLFKLDLFGSGSGVAVGPVIGVPVLASREQRMEPLDSPDAKFDPSLFPSGSVEYVDGGRGVVAGRDDIPRS